MSPHLGHVPEIPQDVRAQPEHHLLHVPGRALRAKRAKLLLDELAVVRRLPARPQPTRGAVRGPRGVDGAGAGGGGERGGDAFFELLHVERRAFELLVGRGVVQAGLNGGAEGSELALYGPSRAVASMVEEREEGGEGDPRGCAEGGISDEIVEAEEPAPAEGSREGGCAAAVPAGEDVGGAGVEEEAECERAARGEERAAGGGGRRGGGARGWGFRGAAGGVHRVRHGARGGHHEGERRGHEDGGGRETRVEKSEAARRERRTRGAAGLGGGGRGMRPSDARKKRRLDLFFVSRG